MCVTLYAHGISTSHSHVGMVTQHQWQAVTAEQNLLQDSEISGDVQQAASIVTPVGLSG